MSTRIDTLVELRRHRVTLEAKLATEIDQLLDKFTEDTGVSVEEINVRFCTAHIIKDRYELAIRVGLSI